MARATQPIAYTAEREFSATLRDHEVRVITKPGLPSWDRITPAMAMLAQAISLDPAAHVLQFGSGHGALTTTLARQLQHGSLYVLEPNSIALSMTQKTLAANRIEHVVLDPDPAHPSTQPASFDVVVMELPSGRKLARRFLAEAHRSLRVGGRLFLAGPNNEGIQPVIEDAQALFGKAALLNYKERNRIAQITKDALSQTPSWLDDPGIAPGTWYEFEETLRESPYHLYSLPGIFSFDRIDQATRLLLDQLHPIAGARVLDIGCGYGTIGLVASQLGAGNVDMIDSNLLAVAAAKKNIRLNAQAETTALPSDALSTVHGRTYDLIVTNPPFHAGKTINYDIVRAFMDESRAALAPDGQIMLVANAFLPYEQVLQSMYRSVHMLVRTKQFQILVGRKPVLHQ